MKHLFLAALLGAVAPLAVAAQAAPPESQVRPLAHFRAIQVGSGIALTITAGHQQRVAVSAATEEFSRHLLTKVVDGVLLLSYDDLLERDDRKLLHSDHKLRVEITADVLSMLTASSGAVVRATGNFAAPDCLLDVSSGATLTAPDLAPGVLIVRENGGATVTVAGTAPRLDVRLAGGATFDGQQLQSRRCQLEAGGGSAVRYYGAATVTKSLSGGSTATAKQ